MIMEIVDIVDKNDKVMGKASRDDVHRLHLWHRVAHVLIFNADNELLLPIRSKTTSVPNVYDCSVSEHVASGETPRAAAIRGLKEELGIRNPRPVFLSKVRAYYGTKENRTMSIMYSLKYDGKIKLDYSEVSQAKFLKPDTVKRKLVNNQEKFAPWTLELLRWYFHMKSQVEEVK